MPATSAARTRRRISCSCAAAAAHFQLGEAYARGRGVLQDYVEAHKWLNLAAARLAGGAQDQAAALRDEVAAHMTPAQIADAQRQAREWPEAFEKRRQ